MDKVNNYSGLLAVANSVNRATDRNFDIKKLT